MEILSTADWQGCLLAFNKLDQAFENDKCCNSDSDFQRDGIFPLVSSKFNSPFHSYLFAHLHDNVFERGREAISGKNFKIARNCLTSTFKHIVMQMRKLR